MNSLEQVQNLPIAVKNGDATLLRNIATITEGTAPGQYQRYNMQRMITVTANISGADLGTVAKQVARDIYELCLSSKLVAFEVL
jgi:multidrug efflux pump subunit AcrB